MRARAIISEEQGEMAVDGVRQARAIGYGFEESGAAQPIPRRVVRAS